MKAYVQGEVDFFCGIYAVINACRKVMVKERRLSCEQGCAFYRHLMQFLIDNGHIEEVLHNGTNSALMFQLLDHAFKYVEKNFGFRLKYECPYCDTTQSIEEMAKDMGNRLNQGRAACLVWVSNQNVDEHWTLVESKGRRILKLLDSYAFPSLPLDQVFWMPGRRNRLRHAAGSRGFPKPWYGKTYLVKDGIIIVSKKS